MAIVLLGFLIAGAIAMTGIGAGVLTAPALILFFDVPVPVAVGTALVFAGVAKLPAIREYVRSGQVHWRAAGAMLAGGLPGVILGVVLLESIFDESARGLVLVLVGSVVLLGAGVSLLRTLAGREAAQSYDQLVDRRSRRRLTWLSVPIGIEVGLSSAGAGALGTFLLLTCTRLAPARAVGTDLVFGLGVAVVGGGLHVAYGSWDPGLLALLALGGLGGSVVGARVAPAIPARWLRLGLLVLLVLLGGQLTLQGVAGCTTHSHSITAEGAETGH